MLIECDRCAMQHTVVCEECVVTFVLGDETASLELGKEALEALDHLADVGLVPRLRLVPRLDHEPDPFDRADGRGEEAAQA